MNGSPIALRQAQGEDLMVSLSNHEVRDNEPRFLKSRMTRRKGPYVARLKTHGRTSAGIAMMQRRCAPDVRIERLQLTRAAVKPQEDQ